MGLPFPSQAWADQLMAEINSSDAYASAAKQWEGDFYFVIEAQHDQGVNEAIYVDLWHGKCREATYTTDLTYKQPEFLIRAGKVKWQRVVTGKQDPVQALITRSLQLDGNMVKIMKNVKAAQELVRCATRIESDFG